LISCHERKKTFSEMFGHGIKGGKIMDETSIMTINTYHANKT